MDRIEASKSLEVRITTAFGLLLLSLLGVGCGAGTVSKPGQCTPTTCAAEGKNCGSISNGCGGSLNCGSGCPSGETCGGGGAANVCSAAGAGTPSAPAVTSVIPRMEGATLYLDEPASNGGAFVTHFTATSYPGGITGTSYGNSTRIDVNGLTAGQSYTFTVTAANANGTGPTSAPSSAVAPLRYADYYIIHGWSYGENPAWGDYNFDVTDTWNSSEVTPLTGTTELKMVLQGSGGNAAQAYFKHDVNPVGMGGGRFNIYPFNYLVVSFWPTRASQTIDVGWEVQTWYDGIATMEGGSSATVLKDSTQNWPTNIFTGNYPWVLLDNTTGFESAITSNTSNTVTMDGLGAPISAGDRYELVLGDQGGGKHVFLPSTYGPNPMIAGQWNTYKVPLTAFDSAGSPIAKQMIYKIQIGDATGTAGNVIYFCDYGFTKN